jgi:hypothetical protein
MYKTARNVGLTKEEYTGQKVQKYRVKKRGMHRAESPEV